MISPGSFEPVEHLLQEIRKYLNAQSKSMTAALQQMVAIPSVKSPPQKGAPFGAGISKILHYTANRLNQLGIRDIDHVDGYALTAALGDAPETVGVLVHLDVVDAGTGWSVPPFEGRIIDGRMYGRGTQDDKGPAVAAMYALSAIARLDIPLKRRILLYFGGDEESGWADMDYYRSVRKMPDIAFSPDSEYPLINAEKAVLQLKLSLPLQGRDRGEGIQILSLHGGFRPNVVPERAECLLRGKSSGHAAQQKAHELGYQAEYMHEGDDYRVVFQGKNAHASTPDEGVNAIAHMLCTLDALPLDPGPAEQCVRTLARRIATQTDGRSLGIAFTDTVSGPLTLNLAQIDLDPRGAEVVMDLRIPITADIERTKAAISEALPQWQLSVINFLPPHFVPEDHFLVQSLLNAYTRETGREAYCMSTGGATYARAIKDAVTFGATFPGAAHLAHQADEYIELPDLELNACIIARALLNLAL